MTLPTVEIDIWPDHFGCWRVESGGIVIDRPASSHSLGISLMRHLRLGTETVVRWHREAKSD
jgi:hypothetical protein